MPKTLTLLDKAKTLKSPPRQTWIRRMPEPQRSEVIAVLTAKASGEIDTPVNMLLRLFAENGIEGATDNKIQAAINAIRSGNQP